MPPKSHKKIKKKKNRANNAKVVGCVKWSAGANFSVPPSMILVGEDVEEVRVFGKPSAIHTKIHPPRETADCHRQKQAMLIKRSSQFL